MNIARPMYWARWLLLPTALLAVVIVIPFACAWFKEFASNSCALEYWYWEPFWFDVSVSMACAMAWVLVVVGIAPSRRLLIAAASIFPGAWLAWFIIGESTLRVEGVGIGSFYATRVPTYLAWWMALATVAALWLLSKHRKQRTVTCIPGSRVVGFGTLALATVLFSVVVLPATLVFWQFTVYYGTQRMIEKGDEGETVRRVIRLHRIPLYDLDWTLPRAIARVPFAYKAYCTLVCCPTCKGHWLTPFLLAARHGKVNLLDKIVELRGSVEYGGDKGATVLNQALISKNPDVVRHLLSEGADVRAEMQLPAGSALHRAVLMDSPPAVIEVLREAGGDLNAIDLRGWTPLDWARVWNTNAVPFLLSIGARGGTNHTAELPVRNELKKTTEDHNQAPEDAARKLADPQR
jgi:hypothetical protein